MEECHCEESRNRGTTQSRSTTADFRSGSPRPALLDGKTGFAVTRRPARPVRLRHAYGVGGARALNLRLLAGTWSTSPGGLASCVWNTSVWPAFSFA